MPRLVERHPPEHQVLRFAQPQQVLRPRPCGPVGEAHCASRFSPRRPSSIGSANIFSSTSLLLAFTLLTQQPLALFLCCLEALIRFVCLAAHLAVEGINAWERLGQRAVRFFDQRSAGGKLLFKRGHGTQSLLHLLLDATEPRSAVNASPPLRGRTARTAGPCLAPQ